MLMLMVRRKSTGEQLQGMCSLLTVAQSRGLQRSKNWSHCQQLKPNTSPLPMLPKKLYGFIVSESLANFSNLWTALQHYSVTVNPLSPSPQKISHGQGLGDPPGVKGQGQQGKGQGRD